MKPSGFREERFANLIRRLTESTFRGEKWSRLCFQHIARKADGSKSDLRKATSKANYHQVSIDKIRGGVPKGATITLSRKANRALGKHLYGLSEQRKIIRRANSEIDSVKKQLRKAATLPREKCDVLMIPDSLVGPWFLFENKHYGVVLFSAPYNSVISVSEKSLMKKMIKDSYYNTTYLFQKDYPELVTLEFAVRRGLIDNEFSNLWSTRTKKLFEGDTQ